MTEKTWVTQSQFDALQSEFEERSKVRRPHIANLIEAARQEGDLSENGGYQAAREEQSMNETRILQLEELLRTVEVGETPADDGVVEQGMVVVAEIDGDREEFLLGARDAGQNLGIHVYSPTAPLGKAILGVAEGETVSYKTPSGKVLKVKIVSAKPFTG